MAGRGATTFQKRQKEQLRKERREAKLARRQQRKHDGLPAVSDDTDLSDNPNKEADDTGAAKSGGQVA